MKEINISQIDNNRREDEIREMFNDKPWYSSGMYESYDKLAKMAQYHPVRRDRGRFTISELLEMVNNGNPLLESFISIGDDIPLSLVPYGRSDRLYIDRDYTFYRYTQKVLEDLGESLNNTLIINMTGHEGPVAAALAEKNIPCNWQILAGSSLASKRLLEQLQDYSNIILQNNNSNNSCIGLILEVQHLDEKTTDISRLPDIDTLKRMGIQKCLVLTEDGYNKHSRMGCGTILDYLDTLDSAEINVDYIGVGEIRENEDSYHPITESNNPEKDLADFHYSNTEPLNPDDYSDNFTLTEHKKNKI